MRGLRSRIRRCPWRRLFLWTPSSIMLWWEFDGSQSLGEVVPAVVSSIPGLTRDQIETATTRLIHGLMAYRLLYLDSPADADGEE